MIPIPEFEPTAVGPERQVRVLLVEDNPDDVSLMRLRLAKAVPGGVQMQHAATLADGMRAHRSDGIDLTLLDLDLPDSAGLETVARMCEVARTPVIVVSGMAHAALLEDAIGRGAYDVVRKEQIDVATLQRLVRLGLRQRQTDALLEDMAWRFRSTFEHAAVGLAHVDPSGRILLANPRLCEMLGYPESGLVGRTVSEISHPEDREATRPLRAQLHAGALARFSARKRYLRADGSTVWTNVTAALVRDEHGAPLYDVACFEDIDDKVRAECALREAEERYRTLIEVCPDAILVHDFERVRFVNPACVKLFGATEPSQVLGRPLWDLVDRRDHETMRQRMRRLAAGESVPFIELRGLRLDGTRVEIEVAATPVSYGGRPAVQVVARDATERRQRERALAESEARFRSLIELTSDWYWEQDEQYRFTARQGTGLNAAGFTYDEARGKTRWEVPALNMSESDWDRHRADLDARREFRDLIVARPNARGEVHYVSVSGRPIFDADGRFRGYRGVTRNVTQQVRAERALRRFRAALNVSADSIYLVDSASMKIIDMNEAACRELGYARDELLGREVSVLFSDRTREQLQHEYALLLERPDGHDLIRAKYRRKDGSRVPVEVTRRILRSEEGVYVVAIARDISERKKAKRRLALHAQRQEGIARFGQLALGRTELDRLFEEAVRTVHATGVDAAALIEMIPGSDQYVMRAACGENTAGSLGRPALLAGDSASRRVIDTDAPLLVDAEYLRGRPGRPWSEWMKHMQSGVYVPIHGAEGTFGTLAMYSVRPGAFGAEDVRYAEAIASVLSSALRREHAERRLAHLAQFDTLTGLPNRNLLQDRLVQTLAQCRRKRWQAGVLFVDLDRFKLVNDTLGHHQGDALIAQVGRRLRSIVRPGDTVGRFSGDEFAVVLADLGRPDDAALVAQKVLDALSRPFDLGAQEAYVTASIGIAVYPGDAEDAESLLKNADMAMYQAKESGRDAFRFFTAEMNQRSVARMQLNTDLRHAIERREFVLHYQPKVSLESRTPCGVEALLRWNHPARGMVPPAEFVPALEESGMIVQVGEWVLEEACAQIKRWRQAGCGDVPVAVNLSAKQFLRRDLDATIPRVVAAAGVEPRLIELEITESCLMANPEEAVRTLTALRQAGFRISVDDFGTGYSSLSYLARFPLSALKIDRAFVREVHRDPSAAAIVRAVIDMAQNLELTVVAEGIETDQQYAFLRRHGCQQGQGYLFSRPLPGDAALHLLQAAA
jgi:diguanylate cyclase (GGDEF)-like protein/PAS domain S-box-containing protein